MDNFNLETVKLHLRIDDSAHDPLLINLMAAAKDFAETFIGRKLDDLAPLPGTVLAGLLLHTSILFEDTDGYLHKQNIEAVKLLYWPYRAVSV